MHLQVSGDLIGSLNIVGILHLRHHSQIKGKVESQKEKGKISRFFVSIIAFDMLDWELSTVN